MPTKPKQESQVIKQARDLHEQLAYVEGKRKLAHEEFEDAIRPAKSAYEQTDAPMQAEAQELRSQLATLCEQHPEEFRSPRKIKTAFGEFGLQRSSSTKVTSEPSVLDWCATHAHEEVIDREPHVKRSELRKLLDAGEEIPGAHVERVDRALVKVVPTIPDPQ